VRAQIQDAHKQIVKDTDDYDYDHLVFGILHPRSSPSVAFDQPYTLILFFEHEHHKHDMSEPDCPKIEIHFTVEPVNFHVDSITCTDDELRHSKSEEFVRQYTLGRETQIVEHTLVIPSTWLKEGKSQHPESFLYEGEH
jgi:hypothetical protein